MTILKGTQGIRAYQLASYYGHLWATTAYKMVQEAFGDEFEGEEDVLFYITDPGLDLEELRQRSAQADEMSPVKGIWSPMFDDNDNIVHVTTSGRLAWTIEPDGTTYFEIYRPNVSDYVLAASCNPAATHVDIDRSLVGHTYLRHFRALAEALEAIGVPEYVIEIKLPELNRDPVQDLQWELDEIDLTIPSPRTLFVERGLEPREIVLVPVEYGWEYRWEVK